MDKVRVTRNGKILVVGQTQCPWGEIKIPVLFTPTLGKSIIAYRRVAVYANLKRTILYLRGVQEESPLKTISI